MIGRRWLWRLSRYGYYKARRDLLNNKIAVNGEADLQRRLAEHLASQSPRAELVAIDVGANLGEWTFCMLAAAREAGMSVFVHAFEPVPVVHEELVRRIAADADSGNVLCIQKCLGSQIGTAEMQLSDGLAGSHSLVKKSESGQTLEVPVTTIEEYCSKAGIEHVDLLKIDAEGFDFEIILGAVSLLREARVGVLQFEYNHCWVESRRFLKDVFELASELDLAVAKLIPGGMEIFPVWHTELERFIEGNYVLGKREHLEGLGAVSGSFDESNTYATR
ncbi:MAG: FkbM family methyltransferase [Myxococcota bacterium]|nr:FkbM family methyltransferase [Myxococcota bacterium]